MEAYKDPTAWRAIANVMREQKFEAWLQMMENQPKRKKTGTAIYTERKRGTGKQILINKSNWFYSQMLREIKKHDIG